MKEKPLKGTAPSTVAARTEYLLRILPADSPHRGKDLSLREVVDLIEDRHRELQKKFPSGTKVTFVVPKKGEVTGTITTYYSEGESAYFGLKGSSGNNSYSMEALAGEVVASDVLDTAIAALDALRTRVREHATPIIRDSLSADLQTDIKRTVKDVMTVLQKQKKLDVTDDDIEAVVRAQKGKSYG